MSLTDRLNFSQEKLFKTLAENLLKSDGKTRNLIDCKENILFAWDSKTKRLFTQNIKYFNKDTGLYQELYPTEPPLFDVHFIRLNATVTKAVLWGPNGVMVMHIPKRWGRYGGFQGEKSKILTRSTYIDLQDVLLHNNEIRQVRFHPGSPQDNHLVILTSYNTLRLYQLPISGGGIDGETSSAPELIRTWFLGQRSTDGKEWNLSGSKLPFLVGLGEMAVDFDFALPIVDNEVNSKKTETNLNEIVWPAIILRGNGDICYLATTLDPGKKSKFEGPLVMYPPADDNYGVEACSILVLDTVPNVVVVATSSGTLYHSVMLKIDEKSVMSSSSHALYVLESVELELGLQLNDDDPSYTCPIFLHKDPISRWKYYSFHNTGLHAVSIRFIADIENFLEKSSVESFRTDQQSVVEYLVCTRTNTTPTLPVLGFTIINTTNIILAFLSNGDIISLPLKISEIITHPKILMDEVGAVEESTTPLKKLLQEPFSVHIKNLFNRNVNQPLVKLDKSVNLSPQESLDLISRTTNLLRKEYFNKFQTVRDEIEQRVTLLTSLLSLHREELKQLESEKGKLKEVAEKLAEKYEEIKDKQKSINERIEVMFNSVLQLDPIESLAEKKMKNELVTVKDDVENFKESIRTVKKQLDYQWFKKEERKQEKHNKNVQLGGNQIETIRTSLNKSSLEIGDIVKVINAIKKQLNITDAC